MRVVADWANQPVPVIASLEFSPLCCSLQIVPWTVPALGQLGVLGVLQTRLDLQPSVLGRRKGTLPAWYSFSCRLDKGCRLIHRPLGLGTRKHALGPEAVPSPWVRWHSFDILNPSHS